MGTIILVFAGWYLYLSNSHVFNIYRAPLRSTTAIISNKELLLVQKDMLDNEQLSRLNDITSGLRTRKNVEVIISRHNEDISWSDMYASIRTVYEKSDEPNVLKVGTPGNVFRLANLGRESHTYLAHIVNNYDTLAELTVFSQGSAPTHKIHRKANLTIHDFVLNEKGDRKSVV